MVEKMNNQHGVQYRMIGSNQKKGLLKSGIGRQAIPVLLERCLAKIAKKQISDGRTDISVVLALVREYLLRSFHLIL